MKRDVVVLRSIEGSALPPRRRSRVAGIVLGVLILAAVDWFVFVEQARAEEPGRYVQTSRGALRGWHADLVAQHFPPEQVSFALRVLACESGGDPDATGLVGERGLFQVWPRYWQPLADALYGPGASLYDPEVNVGTAAAIWRAMGWRAWSCAR